MRRRLLSVLVPLLVALLAALEVTAAQSYATRLTQDLFIDVIGDARRLAARADETLTGRAGRQSLEDEARNLPGGRSVTISDRDNRPVVPRNFRNIPPATRDALDAALSGDDPAQPPTAWPWRTQPITVGIAIGQDSNINGAVVVAAPTDRVRMRIARRITLLGAGGIVVLVLVIAFGVLPLARWVLRPIDDLSATAARLTAGDLQARAAERDGPREVRGLAVAFNRMAATLVAALERQRAFVADASHELRNPLATMRLRIEALGDELSAHGQRSLRLALAEGDRLARTIARLLELARAEATAAERIDFDIVALTSERLQTWRPALDEARIEVRVDAPEQALAHASPDAVEYALDVLLDNARSYAAGAPLDVGITVHDGGVELRVRDHGTALDDGDAPRIGERFWRSAAHRATPGTGLGVATARALLESVGATLELAPAQPGLLATLRLPRLTDGFRHTSAALRDGAAADRSLSQSGG